jgi:hypothetical protein
VVLGYDEKDAFGLDSLRRSPFEQFVRSRILRDRDVGRPSGSLARGLGAGTLAYRPLTSV